MAQLIKLTPSFLKLMPILKFMDLKQMNASFLKNIQNMIQRHANPMSSLWFRANLKTLLKIKYTKKVQITQEQRNLLSLLNKQEVCQQLTTGETSTT